MRAITEHNEEIGGGGIFWRSAGEDRSPVLYLHGVPTSSDDWLPFLERTGGLAPDLPGFGRSAKHPADDYTMERYDTFVESFLDHLGVERVRLLMHDWGVVGLLWAQRFPERVERLVVMNTVPLLPGYRWHRIARLWRTRGVGELLMGATSRRGAKLLTRDANATPGPMPDDWIDSVLAHFDHGTQRAILRLYRSSPSDKLAEAGARLSQIKCPALVVWGAQDPYIPPNFGEDFAAALGGETQLLALPGAGHWPWLDEPGLIETIAAFLDAGSAAQGD